MVWWQYLLLANLYLILFYGFYVLLLRRETFFQLNRVYLVASAVLSFMIPAIQADWVQKLFITQQVNQIIYNQPLIIYSYTAQAEDNRITIGQILAMIYAAGIVFLTLRLLWQLLQLSKFVKQPQAVAFSFFKKINVNAGVSDADVIMAHEEVHAKQWHSADVLIMEAIMILNWFNPVVYFYRRAIKHIHEFIADSKVVSLGVDKAGYAMLLLNHTMNAPSNGLVNQFLNHSLLKKRIMMLQKNRSQRVKLLKYGLSAPLFALMIILSSATINNTKAVKAINKTAEKVLEAPATIAVATTLASADKAINNIIDNNTKTDDTLKPIADTIPDNPTEIFTEVEQVPEFVGGIKAFNKFLSENIRYPQVDRDNNIEGRVFLTFVIQKDGSLSDVKVLRGISSTADAEAVRVIKASPKWKPGYQNGRPVRVQYNVPIEFSLNNSMDDNLPGININGQNQQITNVRVNGKDVSKPDAVKTVSGIDETPQFPGGSAAFHKYLAENVRYPAADRKNKVSGRVFLTFVVQEDGLLTNINVLRSPSLSLQNEAIRILARSPKWIPGKKDGKPVKVAMNVPLNFSLANENTESPEPKPAVANTTYVGLDEVNVVGFGSTVKPSQLVLLDGSEISHQAMEALDPKKIQSMNVLIGENAVSKYGERGKYDVIEITTKPVTANGKVASDFFIQTNGLIDPATKPLIIVDGKEMSYDKFTKINAKDIESVSVLKDASATSIYGLKGKNGVLLVTTKRAIKSKKAF